MPQQVEPGMVGTDPAGPGPEPVAPDLEPGATDLPTMRSSSAPAADETASRYRGTCVPCAAYHPPATISPAAETSTYQPIASSAPMNPPWCSLYGRLSLLKRTSRWGRNTVGRPNSALRSSSSATIGARTASSYTARWSPQYARLLSAASPS